MSTSDNASPILSSLAVLSTRFASQLLEMTRALERGESIEFRIKVMREYAKTWLVVAEQAEVLAGVRTGG